MRGQGHDLLLILGFAFDPYALGTVEEFKPDGDDAFAVQAEHSAAASAILLVRMNADLAMGESLLKKTKAANLFTVFGEPDISPPRVDRGRLGRNDPRLRRLQPARPAKSAPATSKTSPCG